MGSSLRTSNDDKHDFDGRSHTIRYMEFDDYDGHCALHVYHILRSISHMTQTPVPSAQVLHLVTPLTRSKGTPVRLEWFSPYAPIYHSIPDVVHPGVGLNGAYLSASFPQTSKLTSWVCSIVLGARPKQLSKGGRSRPHDIFEVRLIRLSHQHRHMTH